MTIPMHGLQRHMDVVLIEGMLARAMKEFLHDSEMIKSAPARLHSQCRNLTNHSKNCSKESKLFSQDIWTSIRNAVPRDFWGGKAEFEALPTFTAAPA